MRWDLFWVHRSVFETSEADVGFGMFSLTHLAWLAAMTAGIIAYTLWYQRGTEQTRDNLRSGLAYFVIFFEIFKQCTMALTGAPIQENLPLEVCSFAEYAILADALWPKERFLRSLLVFLFLPSAFMALLFPTVTVYPAISFYTIHQFVLHACICGYIIARYAAGEFRADYTGIWTAVLKLLPLGAFIYLIDLSFDKGFMFLTDPYGNPVLVMLWNISGGKGGLPYLAAFLLFVIFILHIAYAVFRLTGLLSRLRTK